MVGVVGGFGGFGGGGGVRQLLDAYGNMCPHRQYPAIQPKVKVRGALRNSKSEIQRSVG